MPGLLFDSDNPAVLLTPATEGCRIATYADLLTPAFVKAAGDRLVVIDRGSGDPLRLATVADIEPGCLTVSEGVAKIHLWIAERRPFPTVYHDRNMEQAVSAALAGVRCDWWEARLDGIVLRGSGNAVAVQFDGSDHLGFHADVSYVWDDAWHPLGGGPSLAAVTAVDRAQRAVAAAVGQLAQAVAGL